jgi:hypothetical protein
MSNKQPLLPHDEECSPFNQDAFIEKQEKIHKKYYFNERIGHTFISLNIWILIASIVMTIMYHQNDIKTIGFVCIFFVTLMIVISVYLAHDFDLPKPYRWIDKSRLYVAKIQRNTVTNEIEEEKQVAKLHDGTIIYETMDKSQVYKFFYITAKHDMLYHSDSFYFNRKFNDSNFYSIGYQGSYFFLEKEYRKKIPTVEELNAPYIINEAKTDERFWTFRIGRLFALCASFILSGFNLFIFIFMYII